MLTVLQNIARHKLPKNETLIAGIFLGIIILLGGRFFITTTPIDMPKATGGELSAANWDYTKGPISLSGEWELYWHSFLTENLSPPQPSIVPVPATWRNLKKQEIPNGPNSVWGHATYRLVIKDLAPGQYSIFAPVIYAPAKIWVNGELVSETGKIAKSGEQEKTVWKGHITGFNIKNETAEILIEVSDYVHGNNAMMIEPVFGPPQTISDYQVLFNIRDLIVQGIATVLFIFSFVLFIFRRQDKASLYFSIFCLLFGTTLSYLGINISEIVIPEASFWTKLIIFYAAEIGSFATFTLYLSALYPNETVKWVNKAIYIWSAFTVIWITGLLLPHPVEVSNPVLSTYIISMILLFAYVLFVVAKAARNKREGAAVFLMGIFLLIWFTAGELLLTTGAIPEMPMIGIATGMTSYGFLIFLLAQVIILAQRWIHALKTAEDTSADLSSLIEVTSAMSSEIQLDKLLEKIVEGATQFMQAERGSLFLYDERTDELWSLIAEGIENKEIRFPAGTGLAGACYRSGKPVNVPEPYKDERFNRQFDIENNFITRNILTIPMETKTGKRIGVMQVLNKIDGTFEVADEQRLFAFASQAAIAIENAELFGEVVQEKNYSESILGSMSNGVVTIGAFGEIEKINTAAINILGGEEKYFSGRGDEVPLFADNKWLLEEVSTVKSENQPRTLMDVDIKTTDQSEKSLNLSIVPLVNEDQEKNGVLMLIEDITGEKRLRGTMTRFMTKEVADKILEQGEATLAGSSVHASIMFMDMRDFTGVTERLGPQETVSMLNEFFSEMTEAIFNWNGVLDKFIGDSIMAVFGAPLEGKRDADNALESGVEMMRILNDLNLRRTKRGEPPILISIGVATGEVIAGTIGSAKRMDYTVVGDSVNLAARLEGVTRFYGADIVVSEETMKEAKDQKIYRELDLIRVKGRNTPSVIYEVLDHHTEETFPNRDALLEAYKIGLAAYRARDWELAATFFKKALSLRPDDRASQIYLERAGLFQQNPPAADWDGVWTMKTK